MPKSALAHDRMDGALVADEFPFSILFEEKFSLDAMRSFFIFFWIEQRAGAQECSQGGCV